MKRLPAPHWLGRAALLLLAPLAAAHYVAASWIPTDSIREGTAAAAALMLLALALLPRRALQRTFVGLCFGFLGWRDPLGTCLQACAIGLLYFLPAAAAITWAAARF